jgi:hypothetical protein
MYHGSIANVPLQACTYKLDEVVLAMENLHVLVSASSMYIPKEACPAPAGVSSCNAVYLARLQLRRELVCTYFLACFF